MKKLLLFLTLTLLSTVATLAQSTLIGTLCHDGEITVFHGSDALIKAHNAAVAGDVITLSAGTFTGTTITKAVTIRGAGMFLEQNPTILSGTTNFAVSEDVSGNTLMLEGLRFLSYNFQSYMSNPVFLKCVFMGGDRNGNLGSFFNNAKFIQCVIDQMTTSRFHNESSTQPNFIEMTNCVIEQYGNTSVYTTISLNNCIVQDIKARSITGVGEFFTSVNTSWRNCIMSSSKTDKFYNNENAVFINCRFKGDAQDPFGWVLSQSSNVMRVDNSLQIFKEGTFYELTDELVSTWVDDNDSQIGIYGGSMPFDPTPLNPQITKFNVASKTSADGKLSVDIEVKAME